MRVLFISIVFLLTVSFSFAQKKTIDKRAFTYYTQDEISQMPDYKIEQINFLYQYSFIIPDEFKGQINIDNIDIRQYSKQRLAHQRAKVFLNSQTSKKKEQDNFTGQYIYLLSIDELQEAYEKFK